MLAKRVTPSVPHWLLRRLRGERTKASSDETRRPPVAGTGVRMEVQAQVSLILVSVAPGGNGDLRSCVAG